MKLNSSFTDGTATTANSSSPPVEDLSIVKFRSHTRNLSDASATSNTTTTWLEDVEQRIRQALQDGTKHPLLIGVAGIPGSAKDVSSKQLRTTLDDLGCLVFPMNGYHYTRQELAEKPNGKDLLWRRGAPDTFDSKRMVEDLRRIRNGKEARIALPGFCHSEGDPRPDQHEFIRHQHKVVICEGLYLLHDADGFEDIATGPSPLLDLALFVDAPMDNSMERLKRRNRGIPGLESPELVEKRVESVDRVNAEIVQRSSHRADVVVPIEDMLFLWGM